MSVYSTSGRVCYKSLKCVGFPKYCVGDNGSVWSCCNNKWGTGRWRKLKQAAGSCDRRVVTLRHNGKSKTFLVHRLVLIAFVGPCPEGMEACHYPDQNYLNNRLENLMWGTDKENQGHRLENGTDCRGTKHWNCKLTVDQVKIIRNSTDSPDSAAKMHRVSPRTIKDIRERRSWAWLP